METGMEANIPDGMGQNEAGSKNVQRRAVADDAARPIVVDKQTSPAE
jgi:hypothetical protein